MSRFFVGQRVRLVRPDSGSISRRLCYGMEGVVISVDPIVDWHVSFGVSNPNTGIDRFPIWSDEIEPITGVIHEACDEEFKRDLDKMLEGLPA